MKSLRKLLLKLLIDPGKSSFVLVTLIFILAVSIVSVDIKEHANLELSEASKALKLDLESMDNKLQFLAESRLLKSSLDLRANMAAVSELDRYLMENKLDAKIFVFDENKDYFAKDSHNYLDRFHFEISESTSLGNWTMASNQNLVEFIDKIVEVRSGATLLGYIRFLLPFKRVEQRLVGALGSKQLRLLSVGSKSKGNICSQTQIMGMELCIRLSLKESLVKSGSLLAIILAFGFAIVLFFWMVVKSKLAQERARTLAELSSQVSHDIQSPLLALKMAARNLRNLKEEQRLLFSRSIARIEDIVNDLNKKRDYETNTSLVKHHLLSGLISSIVSEKRLQFKNRAIDFDLFIEDQVRDSFAMLAQKEFKRLLSNIINNAVEAIDSTGNVGIELEQSEDYYVLKVIDNGKGIAQSDLYFVFEKSYSSGKLGGQGLGLYHAKSYLSKIGAQIKIESTVGIGTEVCISFPKAEKPIWYPKSFEQELDTEIIVVDDDASIHQIWRDKLPRELKNSEIKYFYNFESLEKYLMQDRNKKRFYFVDYEILNAKLTGLEFIETYELQDCSLLVSGRYDDEQVLSACVSSSVKLLPKPLLETVRFNNVSKNTFVESNLVDLFAKEVPVTEIQVYLVDDDPLVHQIWQSKAKLKGVKLHSFLNPRELLEKQESCSKDARIYIDYELGDEKKGDQWAKDFYDLGFKNLRLTTGYSSKSLKPRPWITEVISKDPPF